MWISEIRDEKGYYVFLLNVGDKDVSDPAYVDFETGATREAKKKPSEGIHFNSHVLISKTPDANNAYRLVFEKVPGVFLNSLESHFNWLCKEVRFHKTYTPTRKKKESPKTRPIIRMEGYCSLTLNDAIMNGSLEDVEIVRKGKSKEFDRDTIVTSLEEKLVIAVGKKPIVSELRSFFKSLSQVVRGKDGVPQTQRVFVRLRAPSGQITATEIEPDRHSPEQMLAQALVLNEKISGFANPLPQRHHTISVEVVEKASRYLDINYQNRP